MALAGKGGIMFKLSWLFLSISLVKKKKKEVYIIL